MNRNQQLISIGSWAFPLNMLFRVMTGISLFCAVMTVSPKLAIGITLFVTPALIRTTLVLDLYEQEKTDHRLVDADLDLPRFTRLYSRDLRDRTLRVRFDLHPLWLLWTHLQHHGSIAKPIRKRYRGGRHYRNDLGVIRSDPGNDLHGGQNLDSGLPGARPSLTTFHKLRSGPVQSLLEGDIDDRETQFDSEGCIRVIRDLVPEDHGIGPFRIPILFSAGFSRVVFSHWQGNLLLLVVSNRFFMLTSSAAR